MKNENQNSLKEIVSEIEKLFEVYNNAFFDSKLELPIITIQSGFQGRRKSRGWFVNKVWVVGGTKEVNEINLGAEIISEKTASGIPQIACTLLHEMIHLYNYNRGIQDVTTAGAHTVRNFGHVAESKGLLVTYDTSIFPFVFTEDLNDEGIKIYKTSNFNESLLDKFRVEFNNSAIGKKIGLVKTKTGNEDDENETTEPEERPKKKPKQKNLFCPECNYTVWVAYGFDKRLRCEGTEEEPCNAILLEKEG